MTGLEQVRRILKRYREEMEKNPPQPHWTDEVGEMIEKHPESILQVPPKRPGCLGD